MPSAGAPADAEVREQQPGGEVERVMQIEPTRVALPVWTDQ